MTHESRMPSKLKKPGALGDEPGPVETSPDRTERSLNVGECHGNLEGRLSGRQFNEELLVAMNATEVAASIIENAFGGNSTTAAAARTGSNVDNPLTSNLRVAVSIAALVLNGVGYYGTTFTYEACVKFRLAPPVTKMVAGIACQAIILLRTWAISRKSRGVLIILGVLFVLGLPFLILGNVYRRDVQLISARCIAKQLGSLNTAPMYYGAMSAFDVVACVIATYYLLDLDAKSMSGFTRKVLKHGLVSRVCTANRFSSVVSNIIVLMAVCHVKYIEKLGAFLSVAVRNAISDIQLEERKLTSNVQQITMIMAQHLVLSTQNFNDSTSANYSSAREPPSLGRPVFPAKGFQSSESGKTRPTSSITVHGSGIRNLRGNPTDTFELGVRIQTETHMDTEGDGGVRTVDLQRVESHSSTGASGKVKYDPERGYEPYDEDETRRYDSDAKQLR
ncbi:hypothetical protein AG1IA_04101 [Rhizoctonia solani AG-1 IA]|uniref:Transmembrane protein n=1 Tax=Thanatephorus cucumeris (strain AG1-IA) TaxID=983506 RepID=L8WUS0_THACA|nr:hypothetical protein AG1IA_04101 [Rhizoctonia solani AG-1 IA]